jgi:hypothetical protein
MDQKQELRLAVGEAEAARIVGLSQRALWSLRASGKGPAYRRAGRRVLYPIDGLRAWLGEGAAKGGRE